MIFDSLASEAARPQNDVVISIVSHGHGRMIAHLLSDLASQCAGQDCSISRVVVTLNIPEPLLRLTGWPFKVELVHNKKPRGFGANHNRALAASSESFLCVLNPDIRFFPGERVLDTLIEAAGRQEVGIAYPMQVDEAGVLQDCERAIPTPWALFLRYTASNRVEQVDWVNAACLVLRRNVWEQLAGFDEGYFMYCEDVDLSLRVRLAGLTIQRAEVKVCHAGQRDSRKSLKHFRWHIASLLRLWSSPVFYKASRLLQPNPDGRHRI